jgi:hypothetical protein
VKIYDPQGLTALIAENNDTETIIDFLTKLMMVHQEDGLTIHFAIRVVEAMRYAFGTMDRPVDVLACSKIVNSLEEILATADQGG